MKCRTCEQIIPDYGDKCFQDQTKARAYALHAFREITS